MSDRPTGRARVAIEIPGGEADGGGIAARIERGGRARGAEAPAVCIVRLASLAAETRDLRSTLVHLRACVARAGGVETTRTGWTARAELAVKRFLRRLVQRHLDQQREVNESLLLALERAVDLAERQHAVADENARRIEEYAHRQGAPPPSA